MSKLLTDIVVNNQNLDISFDNTNNPYGRKKMSKVNLDALIPREDFLSTENNIPPSFAPPSGGFSILELAKERQIYSLLRKPDFQRETCEWEPEKVCGLIESFVNQDLIPAVILWRSPSYTFVIDGSHRLSALIAWVNDDYGDKEISRSFYGNIPKEQIKIADKTRSLIKEKVGEYKDYVSATINPKSVEPNIVDKARQLFFTQIALQWLPHADATSAENSFLRINKLAAPVNPTELKLIECRNKPNGIASRAISKAGAGHQYWGDFETEKKATIIKLAKEINGLLFKPPIEGGTTKTAELPIGGKMHSTQTLPLIFGLVNITNGIGFKKQKDGKDQVIKIENENFVEDDINGDATIKYLKNAKRIIQIICSSDSSSLGLYPALYFYSFGGKHKIASFYAIIALIMDFETKKFFREFLVIREQFEGFLMNYDNLAQQIFRKYRSGANGYLKVMEFYQLLIKLIQAGNSGKNLVKKIIEDINYNYLELSKVELKTEEENFSTEKKSEVYLRTALKKAEKCPECRGYYIGRSTTVDHLKAKKDGGKGNFNNAQITHPYCNSIKP